ncbi:hypothetical protein IFR05_003586 [Cadophora sp. M221]|nr:hypothetical protein IFR05_003586 [Cadophora sp. M221]
MPQENVILNNDGSKSRQSHAYSTDALRLNGYIYNTSSVQERLMQNAPEEPQARQVRLSTEMEELESIISGYSRRCMS